MKRYLTGNYFEAVLCALFAAQAVVFIWAFRFLPLQDYPDWLYQGFLFSKALAGKLLSGYHLCGYPVPNTVSTVVIGAAGLLFAPETAGKLFLTACVLLFIAGGVYALGALTPGRIGPLSCLFSALALNTPFFTGNINYVFGLGVLFFALGYLMRRIDDPARASVPLLALFTVLLFFSHAIVYCSLLLFMAVCLGARFSRRALAKFAAAALPSLALLAVYIANHLHAAANTGPAAEAPVLFGLPRIQSVVAYFSVAQYFYPFRDIGARFLAVTGGVNLLFCGALLVLFGWSAFRMFKGADDPVKTRVYAVSTCLLLLLALFSPRRFFGIIDPGERFLFPAAVLLLANIAPRVEAFPRMIAALRTLAVVLLVFQTVVLQGYAKTVSLRMQDVFFKLDAVWTARGATVIRESDFVYGDERPDCPRPPLLPRQSPLIRLPYYLNIKHNAPAPTFSTGIILNGNRFPSLQSASSLNAAGELPETVVVLGCTQGTRHIARLLGPGYYPISEDDHCIALRKRPAGGE